MFGLLFAVLADPGGSYGYRAWHIAVFGVIGAALTALGFGIGGDAWGWLVLAAAAVTLVAGLAIAFGVHRFVAAYLLNIWFIVALAVASSVHHAAHITSYTWAQVLAWVGGSALWIAVTFVAWLIRGRRDLPPVAAELPGDTSRRKLTGPLIMFTLLRTIVIAGTVALAFGLDLSHGYWMPIAAIVAMKASLEQTTVVAAQRLAGALVSETGRVAPRMVRSRMKHSRTGSRSPMARPRPYPGSGSTTGRAPSWCSRTRTPKSCASRRTTLRASSGQACRTRNAPEIMLTADQVVVDAEVP